MINVRLLLEELTLEFGVRSGCVVSVSFKIRGITNEFEFLEMES